jgi:replication factor C small subunit
MNTNIALGIWAEKYRPVRLDDVVLDDVTKVFFNDLKQKQEIPHLLLWGQAGAGKTTLAKILAKDVLNCQYHYINASDKTGIDYMRNEIASFTQTRSFDGKIKLVILDEADAQSSESLKMLRNLMEEYAFNTRFILTANYINKIIQPIQSRCQLIELIPPINGYIKRTLEILKKENVKVNEVEKVKLIPFIKSFYPDLRRAINELQKNTIDLTLKIPDKIGYSCIATQIVEDLKNKRDITSLRRYIIEHEPDFNNDYYLLLKDVFNVIFNDTKIDPNKVKQLLLIISNYMYKHGFALDKEINAFSCILEMGNILN